MSRSSSPQLIVLAGPNGAGKSTVAPALLQGTLRVNEFVNADTIAQGLSAFDPEKAAFAAGRIMLARIKELANERATFAFETTLASKTFAPWMQGLSDSGYRLSVLFMWLSTPEIAIQRVAERVRRGGHDIPTDVIVRRFYAGLRNFVDIYQPLAAAWRVYDNSRVGRATLIATGSKHRSTRIIDIEQWNQFLSAARR